MYAIIDIETTGGSHKHEKITEIAVYVHDGKKVVREFTSLVNPERNIPYFITSLTGISNEMVEDAPKFYEIAKQLVEITEGCIFVAHNVNFDYHFVREEFSRLGYDFKREQLCTVKMSRKLIPGKRSYSLGNLCDELGICITDRHRASGDALATVKLFEILLSLNGEALKGSSKFIELSRKNIHPDFDTTLIGKLPHKTGIYRFLNEKGDIIYIGKSNDIRDRVMSHFNNTTTKKAIEMKGNIADIGYELTGCELVALLLESYEIKKHKPLYNRAQRRTMDHFGIVSYTDSNGYIRFFVDKNSSLETLPLASFNNHTEARLFLTEMVEKYQLCQKLCGLYNSQEACFHFQIGSCKGACTGKEDPKEYNHRANQLIRYFEFDNENFWILGHGRTSDEQSVVRVKNGKYLGFGYIGNDAQMTGTELLSDCIKSYPDNREIQQIIRSYLKNHPFTKIIKE
jgi:DNA polymerase-3 subunit epsilon